MISGRIILSNHKPVAVSYSIASIDRHWCRDVKTYTSVDCVQWFLMEMQQVSEEIREVYQKSMPMKRLIGEEELCHTLSSKCLLCARRLNTSDELLKKRADHCYITGQYGEPACKYCKVKNLSLKGLPIPIIFHNFSGYDLKLIMQHVQDLNISVIANSTEKIKCAVIFVDDKPTDGYVQKAVQINNIFIYDSARVDNGDDDDDDNDDEDAAVKGPHKKQQKEKLHKIQ